MQLLEFNGSVCVFMSNVTAAPLQQLVTRLSVRATQQENFSHFFRQKEDITPTKEGSDIPVYKLESCLTTEMAQ